jgi:hypothetical protein
LSFRESGVWQFQLHEFQKRIAEKKLIAAARLQVSQRFGSIASVSGTLEPD